MDNIITDQNIVFLTFASGVVVGCSVTVILGTVLNTVANYIYNYNVTKKKEKDLEKGELGPLNISDPILESTSFPIASVSPRHSSTVFTVKVKTPCSKKGSEESVCRKEISEAAGKPSNESTIFPASGQCSTFYSTATKTPETRPEESISLREDLESGTSPTASRKCSMFLTTEPEESTCPRKEDDFYSSPTGKPKPYYNTLSYNNKYLTMDKYSQGSMKSPIYTTIEEKDEESHYEIIPPAAETVAESTALSLPPPPPPLPNFHQIYAVPVRK